MSDTTATTTAPTTRPFGELTIPTAGTFDFDASHTHIGFTARHMMVSKVRGHFGGFSGTVTIGDDPLTSSVEVSIDPATVSTGDDKRDAHLLGPDFFDVEQHPAITFTSTGVVDQHGDRFKLEGDLTVLGVTRPVVLDATFEGVAASPWGTEAVGFSATTEIDRDAFGLSWNQALDTGGFLIGKKIRVDIEAELARRAA